MESVIQVLRSQRFEEDDIIDLLNTSSIFALASYGFNLYKDYYKTCNSDRFKATAKAAKKWLDHLDKLREDIESGIRKLENILVRFAEEGGNFEGQIRKVYRTTLFITKNHLKRYISLSEEIIKPELDKLRKHIKSCLTTNFIIITIACWAVCACMMNMKNDMFGENKATVAITVVVSISVVVAVYTVWRYLHETAELLTPLEEDLKMYKGFKKYYEDILDDLKESKIKNDLWGEVRSPSEVSHGEELRSTGQW